MGRQLGSRFDDHPTEDHRAPGRTLHLVRLRQGVADGRGRRLGLAERGREQAAKGDADDECDGNRGARFGQPGQDEPG